MPKHVEPRWHKGHERWTARIGERGSDGRSKMLYAPREIARTDKAGAWEWFRVELARRTVRVVPVDRWTVETVAEHYLAWCEERAKAGDLTPGHYRNKTHHLGHLADEYGARVASSLSAREVSEWARGLLRRFSPHYVANICSTVSAAMNWAVQERHLERNPIAGFDTPAVPDSPERFAEVAEAAAFLVVWRRVAEGTGPLERRYQRLTILLERCLMRTGARPGELCALQWRDIKWDAGTTPAGHSYARAKIPPERWKSGKKTGRSRTIYFPAALSRALRRELGRPDRHPSHVFVHAGGRGGVGWGEPWADGSRLSKSVLRVRRVGIGMVIELRARVEAGEGLSVVDDWLSHATMQDTGPNRVVNYRWRHTAASKLLMLGLDLATVAELLGTSAAMVAKVYGHLLDDHLAAAADRLAHAR